MGALLAPRIDAEGGDFAGLILLAGSPRRLEEVLREQLNEQLAKSKGIIKWIMTKQLKKLNNQLDKIYTLTDEEAKLTLIKGTNLRAYYLKELGEKPAVNYLKVINKPILVMQGDKDFHVSVEKDFEVYKEILSNHPKATFKLYLNLNHMFMKSIYGDISKLKKEYNVSQKVEKYVIDDIIGWIKGGK